MNDVNTGPITVSCTFRGVAPALMTQVVMAAVDQISATGTSAAGDMDIALLGALDVPIEESIDAFHPHGIDSIDIEIADRMLNIVLSLDAPVASPIDVLADRTDLVASFFDIESSVEPARITLTGPLV